MKKLFLFVAAVAMSIAASATDIWTGSKHVSWADGGLQIAADQFANATPGQKIVVTYSDASDGIEFKVMNAHFDHLAGSREAAWITGNGAFEQFLTQTAVDSLKAYGLEIIGANFTCTKVELLDGKDALPEGHIVWTGYFWADDWKTIELYRDGYCNVDFSKVTALRIYSEANRTDYLLKIVKQWEPFEAYVDVTDFDINNEYAELQMTDTLREALANANHWMIQFNKEAGDPFNVTDIVLVMAEEEGFENTAVEGKAIKSFRNGMLVIEKNGKLYNALGVEVK